MAESAPSRARSRASAGAQHVIRGRLLAVGALAFTVFLAARGLTFWPAIVATVLMVGLVNVLLHERERRHVDDLARRVNLWVGRESFEPIELDGPAHWQHLATATNTLGAAHERRGTKLQRERPWRRQLVDAMAVPALLVSPDDQVVAANNAARGLLRLGARGELSITQALRTALAGTVREARERGQAVAAEVDIEGRELRGTAAPVGDEVLLVLSDLSAERRLVDVRRDFVANASHELKSPVAAIASLADALAVIVERDPPRARQLADSLSAEAVRLGKLVHDLLNLSRLEAHASTDAEPVDLTDLVALEVDRSAALATAVGITVRVDIAPGTLVIGHREDLELVVGNLLANAVQYNRPGGTVDVSASVSAGRVSLEVRDTGIGIAAADLDRVFERFYRVDVARSRETGGTGLGLSIVRHAAQRLGGRVHLTSLLGEGTTATVTLPVARTDA